LGGGIDH
jgi:hypothetical protein